MKNRSFIGADLQILKQEASKYDSRTSFFKGSRSAYKECLRRGIMDVVFEHAVRHNVGNGTHGNWTMSNDYLVELAKGFKYRGKFKEAFSSAYRAVRQRGLVEVAFAHMEVSRNKFNRKIYVFEHTDNTAYIGLSYNPEKRRNSHLKRNKILIEKSQITTQSFKVLTGWLSPKEASGKEREHIEQYIKAGWTILNKAKGGALGGNTLKWTKKKCREISSECSNRMSFRDKNPSAYRSAERNGWLEELCEHMGPNRTQPWEFQELLDIAISCKTRYEFKKKNANAYKAARVRGILDQICSHMPKDCRSLPYKDRPNNK